MAVMFVTLDVSKPSGPLNASAYCRVAREGVGPEGVACGAEEAGGREWRRRKQRAGREPAAQGSLARGHARGARKT